MGAKAVGWVYHPFFTRHRTGIGHPEQALRLHVIREALEQAGWMERLTKLSFSAARFADLCLVHEAAYVDLVRHAAQEGCGYIGDRETHLCEESFDVASLAAGGVLEACNSVMRGRVRRAFCAVRPPGHHAEKDQAKGFCLFNHVALAAEHLRRFHGLERVAIVDFDVHHGNGTQHIFERSSSVLYLSLHEHPLSLPFPGTGFRGEVGLGEGTGYTRNVYVPHGCDGATYVELLRCQILPCLAEFEPEFLLLSAGFDAQCTESLAHINLRPEDFATVTAELVAMAERFSGGRLVSVLEGGYELGLLGQSVTAHVSALF